MLVLMKVKDSSQILGLRHRVGGTSRPRFARATKSLTLKGTSQMTKPIPDKAEVALEYPDKFYSGTFERSSRFEASLDATGVLLVLERLGSEEVRKSVHIHINYGLLADILQELASQVPKIPAGDIHRDQLHRAASALNRALPIAPKR